MAKTKLEKELNRIGRHMQLGIMPHWDLVDLILEYEERMKDMKEELDKILEMC